MPSPGFYPHFSMLKPVKSFASSVLEFPCNFFCVEAGFHSRPNSFYASFIPFGASQAEAQMLLHA